MLIESEIVGDECILKEMAAATKTGMIGQLLVLAFVVSIFYRYVPPWFLWSWAGAQASNLLLRKRVIDRFLQTPTDGDERKRQRLFAYYLLSLVAGGVTWAVMDLFVFYLPEALRPIVAIFVLSLTFGATMSLGAATRIYLLFVLPMNLLLMAVYLYLGSHELLLIALFIPIALLFATKAARMHLFDYRSLLEKEAEVEKQKRLYEYRATHDILTDLPNRLLFYNVLDDEIRFARLHAKSFALLFIDLNDFKEINDTYGHKTGDQLLKTFALRFRRALRESDFVARLAGDEFVGLLRNVSDQEEVERVVENIRRIGAQPFSFGGLKIRIDKSIGYAIFPEDATNVKDLMHHADSKMYREKREMKEAARSGILPQKGEGFRSEDRRDDFLGLNDR